jgi:hypothetical protein
MQQQFIGLTMPVFNAFGWAGEEQALKYALTQLDEFVQRLHATLSRRAQSNLPAFGLDRESQSAYLAVDQEPEEDAYIAFYARPLSLELQLAINEQMALSKAWTACQQEPQRWRQFLQDLEGEWTLHVKQMQVDDESGERTSYQDLFKDNVAALDEETAESVTSRAHFLNGEPQWVVPMYISRRFPAEQVSAMGTAIIDVMAEQVDALMPLLEFLIGKTPAKQVKKAKPSTPKAKRVTPEELDPETQFVHVTQLKPLHIRRGFINLTPQHWDFFAKSARSTTRDVKISFEDTLDLESAVWRLSSNDMARIVLGEAARAWLQESFGPDDKVQIVATEMDDEIEIRLEPI